MKKYITKAILYIAITIITLFSIIPFLILLQIVFSTPQQMSESSVWHIPAFSMANIATAWKKSNLGHSMINSTIITITSLILTVFSSSSAGYAIARNPNRVHSAIYNVFIFSMAIPGIISTVPLYLLMRSINAVNSLWGMVMLCSTASLPFAIFLYTSFIRATPKDIEEAAIIDGCSKFSAFWNVLFPVLKPITATVILLNAINYWNEYGRAVFFLQKKEVYTVNLAIATFINKYSTNWSLMAGGTIIAMIPPVVIFLTFQKYYIKGLSSGAVKG